MRYRICPVCGEERTYVLNKINMNIPPDYHLPDSYDVVVCENCGFVYADTSASLQDYNWYYAHYNFYGDDSKNDNSQRYEMVEEFLHQYMDLESVMLEIGAGNGRFLLALQKHGYSNIIGTDPSDESVNRLLQAGIAAYTWNIYDSVSEEETGKYDCIFLFEVAEHLLMPGEGISNITRMLKKEGILMVSVPDYSLLEEDESYIPHYFNLEHINYFSAFSLDNLIVMHGMTRVDQKHIGLDLIQVYRNGGNQISLCRDDITEQAVCHYFMRNKSRERDTSQLVDGLAKSQKDVIIWGTGSYVMHLMAVTDLLKCNIIGFVDNNKIKQGRVMYGYKIYSPEFLQDKRYTVLICSMLNSSDIKEQLEAMRTENDIVIL